MKVILLTLFSLFLAACTSGPTKLTNSKQLDDLYISGGTEKYFLATLPHWVNFSPWASCQRDESIRYLNYENISKSFGLGYQKIVHIQHMWNRKLSAYNRSSGGNNVSLKDESFIFNNIYAQVVGGSTDFIIPKFKKISLIWIDPFITQQKKLAKILQREDILKGYPVMISNCLSSYEIESFIQKYELENLGVKVIPAEMFSIYNENIKRKNEFKIHINQILKDKDITLFGTYRPNQIIGVDRFIKIK
jgi:hypothetical protein